MEKKAGEIWRRVPSTKKPNVNASDRSPIVFLNAANCAANKTV